MHLLRINPIKSEKKAKDCLKKEKESSPEKSKKNGETSPLRELKLPSDNKKVTKPKIMVLDGSECSSETISNEDIDFSELPPSFIEENKLNADNKCLNKETMNIAESLPSYKSKISLKNLLGAPNDLSANGDLNGKPKTNGLDPNGKCAPRTVAVTHCDPPSQGNPEVHQHITKLEEQVKTQASQIVQLQDRIEQIAQ